MKVNIFGLGRGERGFIINFNGLTVSEFGMGVFDLNYTGNTLTAYDINNNIIENITSNVDPEFPVGIPGGTFSTFLGFSRITNDIAWAELKHTPCCVFKFFIQQFLLHVLPAGFVKIRYFGFYGKQSSFLKKQLWRTGIEKIIQCRITITTNSQQKGV